MSHTFNSGFAESINAATPEAWGPEKELPCGPSMSAKASHDQRKDRNCPARRSRNHKDENKRPRITRIGANRSVHGITCRVTSPKFLVEVEQEIAVETENLRYLSFLLFRLFHFRQGQC